MVALGTLSSRPALLTLPAGLSFGTPDANDAWGPREPLFSFQPLLALLATLTIRPWVTFVPLQSIGPHGAKVSLKAWLSPLPNEALLPGGAQRSKVTLHPGVPRKARLSHCTRWPLGSHLSWRTNWPLRSLRSRFSWEALGTWRTRGPRDAREASCTQVASLTSCALLSWLARSAPRSRTALQALGPLLPSWSIRSSRAPASLGSPHAWRASRSWRAPGSRLSRVPNATWRSRMAH